MEDVKTEIQSRLIGTFFLQDKYTPARAKGADLGTLLITGFPGWLGNRMVDILWNADERGNNKTARKVRLLVQPQFASFLPALPANFEITIGDITDYESLLKATAGVSTVWHLAGVIYPKDLDLFEKINVVGTKNLADACVANGVQRFMYMSTDSTCGYTNRWRMFSASEPAKPYKNYGRSKYAGERYIFQLTEQGMLEATSFRGFWFFGPNIPERNLSFFRAFSWPIQPVFGNGKNLRSISHCDDITDAFCKAEKAPATIGKWYWLPTFVQAQTVDEIYKMVSGAFNKKTSLFHVPNFVCDLMSIADTFLSAKLHVLNPTIHAAGKFHKTIATDSSGIEQSRQDFGWQPKVTVGQIQREIVDSMSKN